MTKRTKRGRSPWNYKLDFQWSHQTALRPVVMNMVFDEIFKEIPHSPIQCKTKQRSSLSTSSLGCIQGTRNRIGSRARTPPLKINLEYTHLAWNQNPIVLPISTTRKYLSRDLLSSNTFEYSTFHLADISFFCGENVSKILSKWDKCFRIQKKLDTSN